MYTWDMAVEATAWRPTVRFGLLSSEVLQPLTNGAAAQCTNMNAIVTVGNARHLGVPLVSPLIASNHARIMDNTIARAQRNLAKAFL
jgi:hypothetical protein